MQLDLTVKELTVNELTQPVTRALARFELVSARGIEDGEYTLRYSFGGKQEIQSVRVEYGQFVAGTPR